MTKKEVKEEASRTAPPESEEGPEAKKEPAEVKEETSRTNPPGPAVECVKACPWDADVERCPWEGFKACPWGKKKRRKKK